MCQMYCYIFRGSIANWHLNMEFYNHIINDLTNLFIKTKGGGRKGREACHSIIILSSEVLM